MARVRCKECNDNGNKPFCIYCMRVYVGPSAKRLSQEERVAEIERKKIQEIKDFREKTQQRDLARMLKNMRKVGMKSTGIPSLDMKLKEICPDVVVDDLDQIRLNMLKMRKSSSGIEWIDQKLVEKFGPVEQWLFEIKFVMVYNAIEKCGIDWLDLQLIENFGSRETWRLR